MKPWQRNCFCSPREVRMLCGHIREMLGCKDYRGKDALIPYTKFLRVFTEAEKTAILAKHMAFTLWQKRRTDRKGKEIVWTQE